MHTHVQNVHTVVENNLKHTKFLQTKKVAKDVSHNKNRIQHIAKMQPISKLQVSTQCKNFLSLKMIL